VRQIGMDRFYGDFLCPLFFEGFACRETDRSTATNKLLGKVPYLDGGLFMRHQIEELYGQRIQIADLAFEKVFAFFEAYQWHLDERPLRRDDEINPDVLGYIFEKYINQKQMGAYYTKEDITEYISKNTIIPFLFDYARQQPGCADAFVQGGHVWRLLAEDADRYIYDAMQAGVIDKRGNVISLPPQIEAGINDVSKRGGWNRPADPGYALPTETWREHVARRQRCLEIRGKLQSGQVADINDLVTLNLDVRQFAQDVIANCESPELLRALYGAIEKVTVLDPTCGSGAFLFAALGILEPLYEACIERMESFVSGSTTAPSIVLPSVAALRSKMLGEQATASRFADFKQVLARIAKHPNDRYFILKSIIVNNLFGVDIMEEAVEICKLRLFLKLIAQVEQTTQIEPLPDIDFNIRAGNTLVGYASYEEVKKACDFGQLDFEGAAARIAAKAQAVEQRFTEFREKQLAAGRETPTGLTHSLKQAILKPLNELRDELDHQLAASYDISGDKKFLEWRKTHEPFHWFVEFFGIIKGGGFDIIIGNPPYVEYSKIKKCYTIQGYETESCGNLYAFVWERCLSIAAGNGRIGMIQPVAAVCTDGYQPLQSALRTTGSSIVSNFNDRPSKLFDGLEHIRLCIILHHKGGNRATFTTTYNKWQAVERGSLFQKLSFSDSTRLNTGGAVAKIGSSLEASILLKLAREKGFIGEYECDGKWPILYTRKLSHFVQILDFVPTIKDASGRKREPSELKQITFDTKDKRNVFLGILNSSLFYWLLTVYSDCRNLNRRDIGLARFDLRSAEADAVSRLSAISDTLMHDIRAQSKMLTMNYKEHGRLRIQCTYPKLSKSIIDEIDSVLAAHYGFTDIEADFIVNYDIKYRMGGEENEAEGVPEAEDAGQTFPATARDRQLCAVALELVKAVPGVSWDVWLDGIVLAVKTDTCEKALLDAVKRRRFRQLIQKHPLDLFGAASIPWNDLWQTLTGAGAVEIDKVAQTVSEGAGWQALHDPMDKLPAGFITLVAEALKNITDNAADLAQAGMDTAAMKQSISQARATVG
jgi:hypothetical protein